MKRPARGAKAANADSAARGRFVEPVGPAHDAFEREAHRVADVVARGGLAGAGRPGWSAATAPEGAIQRMGGEREEDETIRRLAKAPAPEPKAAASPTTPPSMPDAAAPDTPSAPGETRAKAGPALLAEDEADVTGGQMRKSEFLAALRVDACAAVDEALSGTGRDSQGCPWIEHWLGYYEGRSAAQVERALHRYAPEARGASGAQQYIHMVTARVRRSAETWAKTGEITGVPDDVPAAPMAGGSVLSLVGGMFFKARPGGARRADPVSVRDQLGGGRALPDSVRARMEPAFGASFAGVRVHTDAAGSRLSDRLNARAFTVGRHVAFGAGEYRPGTLAGDALIAHELAHVVQQRGAQPDGVMARSSVSEGPVEADANRSAVAVVSSLLDRPSRSMGRARTSAMPLLRSGLALSRCKSERQKEIDRLGAVQLGFLEDKRKAEEARLKKEAEDDAKKKGLPPPPTAPKVELEDIVKKDVGEHSLKASPTKEWDEADQDKWKKDAAAAWTSVVASVKGTELESIVKGVTFVFDPKKAFEGGFYASYYDGSLTVGMSWVKLASQDPKNVWENIAHEVGGHARYGTTYASEIMDAALSKLSSAEAKRVRGDSQKFFETYSYPETEIYASLWQRRYRVPVGGGKELPSGGIHPDINIPKRLHVMQDALHPDVAKAVLVELKRRIDQNDQILQRDKDFFLAKVKEIFGYSL